jgi:hypothetical protein
MKFNQITADIAREDDIDSILRINEIEYGPNDLAMRQDYVWRHVQNPAGQAIVPVIRDSSGSVVGFIWILPLRIRIRGQDLLAAIGANLVIHPDYRDTFGYAKLIRRFEQVFKEKNIGLHFSFISEKKYRQLRGSNTQAVTTIPLLVKPLDFESLARSYFSGVWQSFIVGQIGRFLSPFLFRQRKVASWKEIAVQAVDQFNQDFDKFWHKIRDKYPVMAIRDRVFLSWRFASGSKRHYHILVARARGQTVGYAVLRCKTIRGVKAGLIMDLLVTDDALGNTAAGSLIAEAEAYFRVKEISVVLASMVPSAAEYRVLRRAGYINLIPAFAPRTYRFAFFIHNSSESSLVSLSARDWFITQADYEAH